MPARRLQFDHFEIATDDTGSPAKLGPGGMGTTFRAYDTRLRKFVALKIINERLLADASIRHRFFNEARAAALVDHPNVARVLYLCPEDADEAFFTMELVDGESLGGYVARHGPMAAGEALLVLRAVADALGALSEHRLVHRDIKPDNIMIARTGSAAHRVKLIDFGLAKSIDGAGDRFASVQTGARFVGSVYFASPEQIRPRAATPVDACSDFYSLGATLWHVLTGFPPFTGTVFEVQEGHVYNDPPWEKIAALPGPIHALLRRLLAKDPTQRPPDADALLVEWDAAITGLEAFKNAPPLPRATGPVDEKPTTVHEVAAAPPPQIDAASRRGVAWTFCDGGVAGTGCAAPPPPTALAREDATGDWLAVRHVPDALELRAEFLAAARTALATPHAGLLNVREVRETEVVSDWPRGVFVATLLARQRGALPLEVVLAWLPTLAETADHAREHGLSRTGLDPARWLVSFESLAQNETPADRAAQPPGAWGAHYVALDPLAGFDAQSATAATAASHTMLPDAPPLRTHADWLAAFARAIHALLGGHDRPAPVPSLDGPRNELLLDAIHGRASFPTAHEWAAAFLECGAPLKERRFPTADEAMPRATRAPTSSIAPPAHPPIENGAAREAPTAVGNRRSLGWRTLVAALFLIAAGIAAWQFWPPRGREPNPQPTPAPIVDRIAPLLLEVQSALAKKNIPLAEQKLAEAENIAPGDTRIAAVREKVDQEKQIASDEAEKKRQEAERMDLARGGVELSTDPPGAAVKVDGIAKGTTPASVSELRLGKHPVSIELPGYDPVEREVEITADQAASLGIIKLTRSAGILQIVTEPPGQDYQVELKSPTVSGETAKGLTGKTPATLEKLPTGIYSVTLNCVGWPDYTSEVTVERGKIAPLKWEFATGTARITSTPVGATFELRAKISGADALRKELKVKQARYAEKGLSKAENASLKERIAILQSEIAKAGQSLKPVTGKTPADLADIPVGTYLVVFSRPNWPEQRVEMTVAKGQPGEATCEFSQGTLDLSSEPAGAAIFLGERSLGKTPLRVEAPTGENAVRFVWPGWPSVTRMVRVDKESVAKAQAEFVGGDLEITSEPSGASVSLAGKSLGTTPLMLKNYPPGTYQFSFSKTGYKSATAEAKATVGSKRETSAYLEKLSFAGTWTGVMRFKSSVGETGIPANFTVRISADEKTAEITWSTLEGAGFVCDASRTGETLTWSFQQRQGSGGPPRWRSTSTLRLNGDGSATFLDSTEMIAGPNKGVRSSYSGTMRRQ